MWGTTSQSQITKVMSQARDSLINKRFREATRIYFVFLVHFRLFSLSLVASLSYLLFCLFKATCVDPNFFLLLICSASIIRKPPTQPKEVSVCQTDVHCPITREGRFLVLIFLFVIRILFLILELCLLYFYDIEGNVKL